MHISKGFGFSSKLCVFYFWDVYFCDANTSILQLNCVCVCCIFGPYGKIKMHPK